MTKLKDTNNREQQSQTIKLTQRGKLAFSILGFLISAALVFLLGELIIRLAMPQTLNVYAYDPDYVFKFRPNAQIDYTSNEFSQVTTFNSHGFKDNEYDYENKPAGTYRALVLGDSFAVGLEVALNETFVKRLEQQLRTEFPDKNIEVLSTATNGWSTEQELLFLQKEGMDYNPDLVVLAYYVGNDQIDNAARSLFTYENGKLAINHKRPLSQTRLRSAYYFITSYSQFFNALMYTYWKIRSLSGKPSGTNYDEAFSKYLLEEQPEDARLAWEKTLALLEKLYQTLNERKIPLALLIIPDRLQELPAYREKLMLDESKITLDKPQNILHDFAEPRGIPVIDLLPAFQNAEEQYHYEKDFHWNPAGHALAADAVQPRISSFINQN